MSCLTSTIVGPTETVFVEWPRQILCKGNIQVASSLDQRPYPTYMSATMSHELGFASMLLFVNPFSNPP